MARPGQDGSLSGLAASLSTGHYCRFSISINPQGTITNSDLELTALVLQEVTLLETVPKACMAALRSGSDNTPTVS